MYKYNRNNDSRNEFWKLQIDIKFAMVTCSHDHTMALDDEGYTHLGRVCGRNKDGQLENVKPLMNFNSIKDLTNHEIFNRKKPLTNQPSKSQKVIKYLSGKYFMKDDNIFYQFRRAFIWLW